MDIPSPCERPSNSVYNDVNINILLLTDLDDTPLDVPPIGLEAPVSSSSALAQFHLEYEPFAPEAAASEQSIRTSERRLLGSPGDGIVIQPGSSLTIHPWQPDGALGHVDTQPTEPQSSADSASAPQLDYFPWPPDETPAWAAVLLYGIWTTLRLLPCNVVIATI